MPLLISVLGSCLVAASTAAGADGPNGHAGEPWWSNPPTAVLSGAGPKVTEFPSTVAAGSGPKIADGAPVHADLTAEFAPDPPGSRRADVLPAGIQQEPVTAAGTPVGKPKTLESASLGSVKPLPPPRQLPATGRATSPVPPEPSAGTPPATASSSPIVRPASAAPLGLGSHNDKTAGGKGSPLSAVITVGGCLAIVLGLFFFVAWAMRKSAPRGSLLLPKEVFEILGRAPLGARQQVQMLRCGNKLLLVSITPNGTETLTEVTDPLEVDRIAGICQQAHPKSTTMAFRQVFQQLAPQAGETEELENLEPAGTRRKRYRWEEKHV